MPHYKALPGIWLFVRYLDAGKQTGLFSHATNSTYRVFRMPRSL